MIKSSICIGFMWMGVLAGPLAAQNDSSGTGNASDSSGVSDEAQSEKLWEANVGGGQYVVSLSRITSVSRHRYVLDGSLIVDEVTVDTSGQSLARFYHITPITDEMRGSGIGSTAARMADRGKQFMERGSQVSGTRIHEMVQKKFPLTTHAKQIEYRVMSEQALTSLYNSVKSAWSRGRGRVFTIR